MVVLVWSAIALPVLSDIRAFIPDNSKPEGATFGIQLTEDVPPGFPAFQLSTKPGGKGAPMRLVKGDVIMRIDDKDVKTWEDYLKALATPGQKKLSGVDKDNKEWTLYAMVQDGKLGIHGYVIPPPK